MTCSLHLLERAVISTAAVTLHWFLAVTPAAAITATPTASPIIRSALGTVLVPGSAGLEPAAGIAVQVFPCGVSSCLGASDTGETLETNSTGQFSFAIAGDRVVARASLDSEVLRAVVYENGSVMVDPISEAMVQLIAERELFAYTTPQLRQIEDEIRRANSAADFAGLTIADAVALALANARADAGVGAVLVAWTPTPRPTFTATSTASPTPTPYPAVATATRRPCMGDCDRSMTVSVHELVTGVGIVLGTANPDICPAFDDPQVSDLVEAVGNALGECVPPPPLPDLVIERAYVYGAACTVDDQCGTACVVNAGNAAAAAFDVLFGTRIVLPGLAAGEGQCLGLCSTSLRFMGAIMVDTDAAVEELDEDNNTFAFSYPSPTPGSCP